MTILFIAHFLLVVIISLSSVAQANLSNDCSELKYSIFHQLNNQSDLPKIHAFSENIETKDQHLSEWALSELITLGYQLNKNTHKDQAITYIFSRYKYMVNKYAQEMLIESFNQLSHAFFDRAQTNIVFDENWSITGYELDYLLSIIDFDNFFLFNQLGLRNQFETNQASWGVGFRHLFENSTDHFYSFIAPLVWGLNIFADADFEHKNARYSIGFEAAKPGLKFNANRYLPITDYNLISKPGSLTFYTRPASGYDVNLTGYLTFFPEFFVTYSHFEWSGQGGKVDISGKLYASSAPMYNYYDNLPYRASGSKTSLTWNPIPLIGSSISINRTHDDIFREVEGKINITFRTDKSLTEQIKNIKPKVNPMTLRMNHDFVERNKRMVMAIKDNRSSVHLQWDDADARAGLVIYDPKTMTGNTLTRTASITTVFPPAYKPSAIEYGLVDSSNPVATVNSKTAKVDIVEPGYTKIKATYPSDVYYMGSTIEYKLKSMGEALLDVPTCEYENFLTNTTDPCLDLATPVPGGYRVPSGVHFTLSVKKVATSKGKIHFDLDASVPASVATLTSQGKGFAASTTASTGSGTIDYQVSQDATDLFYGYSQTYPFQIDLIPLTIKWDDSDAQSGRVIFNFSPSSTTLTRTASTVGLLPPSYTPEIKYGLKDPTLTFLSIDNKTGKIDVINTGTAIIQAEHALGDGISEASNIIEYELEITSESKASPPKCTYISDKTATVRNCDQDKSATADNPFFNLYNGIKYTLTSNNLTINPNPIEFILDAATVSPSGALSLEKTGSGETKIVNTGNIQYTVTQTADPATGYSDYTGGPYNLTVKKDDLPLTWDDPSIQSTGRLNLPFYKNKKYTYTFSADIMKTKVELDTNPSSFTYAAINQNPPNVINIDSITGEFEMMEVGKATIKGILSNDPNYNDAEISFELESAKVNPVICRYSTHKSYPHCQTDCIDNPPNGFKLYAQTEHGHFVESDSTSSSGSKNIKEMTIDFTDPPPNNIEKTTSSGMTGLFKTNAFTINPSEVSIEYENGYIITPIEITVIRNTIELGWNDSDAASGKITIIVEDNITKTASIISDMQDYPSGYDPKINNITYRLNPDSSNVATINNATGEIKAKKRGTVEVEAIYPSDDFTNEAKIVFELTVESKPIQIACTYISDKTSTIRNCDEDPTSTNINLFFNLYNGIKYTLKAVNPPSNPNPIEFILDVGTLNPFIALTLEKTGEGKTQVVNKGIIQYNVTQAADSASGSPAYSSPPYNLTIKKDIVPLVWDDPAVEATRTLDLPYELSKKYTYTFSADILKTNVEVNTGRDVLSYDIENPNPSGMINLDSATGEFYIYKSGEVTVKGILSGDNNYADAETSFLLKANKKVDLVCMYSHATSPNNCKSYCTKNSPTEFTVYAQGAHWHIFEADYKIRVKDITIDYTNPIGNIEETPDLSGGDAGIFLSRTVSTDPASVSVELVDGSIIKPVYITVIRNTIDLKWDDSDAQSGKITINIGKTITKTASIASDLLSAPYPAGYNPKNRNIAYQLDPPTTDVATINNATGKIESKKAGSIKVEAVYPEDDYTNKATTSFDLVVEAMNPDITVKCRYVIKGAHNEDDCHKTCDRDTSYTDPINNNFLWYAQSTHYHLDQVGLNIDKFILDEISDPPDAITERYPGTSMQFWYKTGSITNKPLPYHYEMKDGTISSTYYITVIRNTIDLVWDDNSVASGVTMSISDAPKAYTASIDWAKINNSGIYPYSYDPQDSYIRYKLSDPSSSVATVDNSTGEITPLSSGTVDIEAVYPEDRYTNEATISFTLNVDPTTPSYEIVSCKYTAKSSSDPEMCNTLCNKDPSYATGGSINNNFIWYSQSEHYHLRKSKHMDSFEAEKEPDPKDAIVRRPPTAAYVYTTANATNTPLPYHYVLKDGTVSPTFYITVIKNTIDIIWEDKTVSSGVTMSTTDSPKSYKASVDWSKINNSDVYPYHYDPKDSYIRYRLSNPSSSVASVDNTTGEITPLNAGTVDIEAVYPEDNYTNETTTKFTLTVTSSSVPPGKPAKAMCRFTSKAAKLEEDCDQWCIVDSTYPLPITENSNYAWHTPSTHYHLYPQKDTKIVIDQDASPTGAITRVNPASESEFLFHVLHKTTQPLKYHMVFSDGSESMIYNINVTKNTIWLVWNDKSITTSATMSLGDSPKDCSASIDWSKLTGNTKYTFTYEPTNANIRYRLGDPYSRVAIIDSITGELTALTSGRVEVFATYPEDNDTMKTEEKFDLIVK